MKKVKKPFVCPEKNICPLHFSERKSGFTVNGRENVLPTDSGREFPILVWISYEEPLQTSCLGNHWFYVVFAKNVEKALVLQCSLSK